MPNAPDWIALLMQSEGGQEAIKKSGINPKTIYRWQSGQSKPSASLLRSLLAALPPEVSDPIKASVIEAGLLPADANGHESGIPSSLYKRVLQCQADLPSTRYWSIGRLVLDMMRKHLDPYQKGVRIFVARCFPTYNTILCLQETFSQHDQVHFYGRESLLGQAVLALCPLQKTLDEKDSISLLHPHQNISALSRSTIVIPFIRSGRVSGSLQVIFPYDFPPPSLVSLIHEYATLLTTAFEDKDFFDRSLLDLRSLPV